MDILILYDQHVAQKVCGKPILYYLLDNLHPIDDEKIYLIIPSDTHSNTQSDTMYQINNRYKSINIIISSYINNPIEMIYDYIKVHDYKNRKLLILEPHSFYTVDILEKCRNLTSYSLGTHKTDNTLYFFPSHQSFLDLYNSHETTQIINIFKKLIDNDTYISQVILSYSEIQHLQNSKQIKYFTQSNKCFLFDLDGTLVLTDDLYFNVWKDILKEFGINLTHTLFIDHIQGKNDQSVVKSLMLPVSPNYISQRKDNSMIHYLKNIKLIQYADKYILDLMSKGHPIAIVTNSNRLTAKSILEYFNIKYDLLITSDDISRAKPYPDPYLKALAHFDMINNQAVIFEDSPSGVLSALATSPACIVGIVGTQTEEKLLSSGCNIVIQNFLELQDKKLEIQTNKYLDDIKTCILSSLKNTYSIQKIVIEPTKLKGGYIADVLTVTLILQDNQKVECVLKLENPNQTMLSTMANTLDLYEREYYFYQSISQFAPINTPKFISLVKRPDLSTAGILLQRIKDPITLDLNYHDIETTLKIVDKCAKFHAWSWNKNICKIFPYLKKHNDTRYIPDWYNYINTKLPEFINKWSNILNQKQIDLITHIGNSFNRIQEIMSTGDLCLCHGDVKSPNIIYEKNNNEPIFIDWQYISAGKGVADIVFFMIESFELETIEKWENIIEQYYYIKLIKYGVTNYTIQNYKRDLVASLCHFPFFVAIWFGTTPNEDLIDVNFPYFFIQRYMSFLSRHSEDLEKLL